MSDNLYIFWAIVAMALVTFALRSTPFIFSKFLKQHVKVQQLGRFLPPAIMSVLLVDTVRGLAQHSGALFVPEMIAVLSVVLCQWLTRHALLSMAIGVGLYVLLLFRL